MQMIKLDSAVADQFAAQDCEEFTQGLCSRWFEKLRTIRQRLQRWVPALSSLPLWTHRAGDLAQTVSHLQTLLDEMGDTIARISDPRGWLTAASVQAVEAKIDEVTRISNRLERELASAAMQPL